MSQKTKITLMEEREKSIVLNNPGMVDVVFVEEMFFLHLHSDLPKTFELSRSILRKLWSSFCSKRIDNALGKRVRPSIKDTERHVRAQGLNRDIAYETSDPTPK